jgi:excisionase family DNA binding protein
MSKQKTFTRAEIEAAMSSPEEVAVRNRRSRTYIYEEIRAGRLIAVKAGRCTRIRREDEDAWRAALPVRQPCAA